MACVLFGLTPDEVLAGVTCHASRALGLAGELGSFTVGQQADFLVWNIDEPAELVCHLGVNVLRQRVFNGVAS
jgi:imidazolonepropionase